jgi:hypothetical protein
MGSATAVRRSVSVRYSPALSGTRRVATRGPMRVKKWEAKVTTLERRAWMLVVGTTWIWTSNLVLEAHGVEAGAQRPLLEMHVRDLFGQSTVLCG